MNWYYVEAGQQAGPVDDTQLAELVRGGRIQADTLVWREGLTNWQPYNEIASGGTTPAAAAPPVMAGAPAPASEGTSQEAVCAECGGLFNIQDTIPYGNIRVCANCKPVFMQKLAEGARLNTGQMIYAGFWTRFAAVFLDGIILWVVNTGMQFAAGLGFGGFGSRPTAAPGAAVALLFVLQIGIALSYETVMIGKFGATLGKMACKIQVVTADGGRVSYLRSLGRYFSKLLSGMICLIGYIMAAFDDQKRALHDRICDTRVVIK